MQMQYQYRTGGRLALLFGSVGLLVLSALLQSCADTTSPGPSSQNGNALLRLGQGGSGIAFDNVDGALVYGYTQCDLRFTHDDRLGDESGVYYSAVSGDADGAVPFTSATVDGTSLALTNSGVTYYGYSEAGTVPGGNATWALTQNNGVTLNATIAIPTRPDIVSPAPYQTVSAGGFNITTGNSNPDGDIVAMIVYDSYRDREYGLADGPPTSGASVRSVIVTAEDDGTIEIPATSLVGLAHDRVYDVIVYRWRYQTALRSDGNSLGMLADVQYAVPVILGN